MHLANYYCAHCIIWMQTCHSLFLSVHCICRPAGIPVVPVYEEDEPNTRRKVQRITSPEKWELKQVNIDSEKKNNTIIQDRIGAHVVYKGSCASCSYCYVGETSAHVSSPVPPPPPPPGTDILTFWNISEFRFSSYLLFNRLFQCFWFCGNCFKLSFFQ